MLALSQWNGGVIIISHDEKFITTVAKEVRLPSPPILTSSLHLSSRCRLVEFVADGTLVRIAVGLRRRNGIEVQGRRAGLQGPFLFSFRASLHLHLHLHSKWRLCVDTDLDVYGTFTFAESDCEQCEEDALILELEA